MTSPNILDIAILVRAKLNEMDWVSVPIVVSVGDRLVTWDDLMFGAQEDKGIIYKQLVREHSRRVSKLANCNRVIDWAEGQIKYTR